MTFLHLPDCFTMSCSYKFALHFVSNSENTIMLASAPSVASQNSQFSDYVLKHIIKRTGK